MNWILVAVLGIIAVLAWVGLKKGFIKMVFSLVSTVIALLVAMLFSPMVAGMMKNNEAIVGFFDEKIGMIVDFTPEEAEETTESGQESLISSLPLPEIVKESLMENNTVDEYMELQAQNFEEYVHRRIANVIINALAFVLTLVLAVIGLVILCNALNLIAKLPLLRQINAVAGLAAGAAEGLLLVWVLFAVLTMFAGTEFGREAMSMIAENPLLDYLYKNNLVSKFIARG
ncbi:MAG: CvpA family protein [Lachnospiraceae bacterium]|nr:CvpA family protein [Lachnospiraceae bacterium]